MEEKVKLSLDVQPEIEVSQCNIDEVIIRLTSSPELIADAERHILKMRNKLMEAEAQLANKKSEVVRDYFDKVDPATNKKLYSNDDKRDALMRSITAPLQQDLDQLKLDIAREEIELNLLRARQTNDRYILDYFSSVQRASKI